MNNLKTKAAEILVSKFTYLIIHFHPGRATQQQRQSRQRKDLTKYLLLNLFGSELVTNKVLPLEFSSVENSPNPDR